MVLCALGKIGEVLTDNHKGIAVIEVVAVNDTEGFFNHVLAHKYGMVRTPWFLTAFWYAETFGQSIKCLEAELTRYLTLILRENLCTELLLHNGLPVGSQTVELLQTAIAAAHTCCQQKKSWFHKLIFYCFNKFVCKDTKKILINSRINAS